MQLVQGIGGPADLPLPIVYQDMSKVHNAHPVARSGSVLWHFRVDLDLPHICDRMNQTFDLSDQQISTS